MLGLNDATVTIRLKELKLYLQKIDRREDRIDHARLIMKYNLNMKIYENQLNETSAELKEMKVVALEKRDIIYKDIARSGNTIAMSFAKGLINTIRFFMGKDFISDLKDSSFSNHLSQAYYFERNRKYAKAIEYFDQALDSFDADPALKSGISLHKGFCFAMMQKDAEARREYRYVLDEFNNEDTSVTAVVLLRYLDGFKDERGRVSAQGANTIHKSKKLFRLMAYKQSKDILNKAKANASLKERDEIDYYIARINEEQGNVQDAVNQYRALIASNRNSHYAKKSNRRLFSVGTRSESKALIEFSEKVNKQIGDSVLKKMIKDHKPLVKMTAVDKKEKVVINLGQSNNKKELQSDNSSIGLKIGKKIKVQTTDGNTFVGTVVKESPSAITIKTLIGPILVKRTSIKAIIPLR